MAVRPEYESPWPPAPNRQLCAHVGASGWGVAIVMPLPLGRYLCGRGHRSTAIVARWGQSCPALGCAGVGLLVVAGPATGQLNTRFAWRPGQRMFGAVGDPWSKQPVAPSAQSGVD